jgi:hypothetical protein
VKSFHSSETLKNKLHRRDGDAITAGDLAAALPADVDQGKVFIVGIVGQALSVTPAAVEISL